MKKLAILLFTFLLACAPVANSRQYADTFNYKPYWGKTIQFMGYYEHAERLAALETD